LDTVTLDRRLSHGSIGEALFMFSFKENRGDGHRAAAGGGALTMMPLLISVGGLSRVLNFFYLKGIILDSFSHLISHRPMCVYILFVYAAFICVLT
jgi:hypothetical protein